jgi:hypothetical protein
MTRKWKIGQLMARAIVTAAGVTAAHGNITVQWVGITPSQTATTGAQILAANGWGPFLLVATADAASGTVSGWDLASPSASGGVNKTGTDWGIFTFNSYLAQRWPIDFDSGAISQSNYGTAPAFFGSINNSIATSPDSFFAASAGIMPTAVPSEDNNLANGTNPPYDRNPVPDNLGSMFDTGVGTFMKAAETVQAGSQAQTQVIAQVWAPTTGEGDVRAVGMVTDAAGNAFFFSTMPEPGTMGMLGVGVVMLMRRRRMGRRGRAGGPAPSQTAGLGGGLEGWAGWF